MDDDTPIDLPSQKTTKKSKPGPKGKDEKKTTFMIGSTSITPLKSANGKPCNLILDDLDQEDKDEAEASDNDMMDEDNFELNNKKEVKSQDGKAKDDVQADEKELERKEENGNETDQQDKEEKMEVNTYLNEIV